MAIDWSKYDNNQLAKLAVQFMDEGDMEAAQLIRSKMTGPMTIKSPTQADYARVQGRQTPAALAPLVAVGEGALSTGRGIAQTLLPKSLEKKFGITDEQTEANRAYREGVKDVVRQTPIIGAPYAEAAELTGQLVPEIAGGAGVASGLSKVPALVKAAQAAKRIAPRTASALAASAGGAASGLAVPTTESDIFDPVLVGAGLGAVAPAVAKVAGGAKNLGGSLLIKARAAVGSKPAARQIADENIAKFLGEQYADKARPFGQREDFTDVINPGTLPGVQLGAAETYGGTPLATLENLSRREQPMLWRNADDVRAEHQWEALRGATPNKEDLLNAEQKVVQLQQNPPFDKADPGTALDAAYLLQENLANILQTRGDIDPAAERIISDSMKRLNKVADPFVEKPSAMTQGDAEQLVRQMQTTIEYLRKTADTEFTRGYLTPASKHALENVADMTRIYQDVGMERGEGSNALLSWLSDYAKASSAKENLDAAAKLRARFQGYESGALRNVGTDTGSGATPKLNYATLAAEYEKQASKLNPQQRAEVDKILEDLRSQAIVRGEGVSGGGQFVSKFSGREATPIEAISPNWLTTGSSFIANKAARGEMPKAIYDAMSTPEKLKAFRHNMLLQEALRNQKLSPEEWAARMYGAGSVLNDLGE